MRFQGSTKILDNIHGIQRSLSIKSSLNFHRILKGESSSHTCTWILKDNIMKSEIIFNEIRSQPNQHPKKMKSQNKSFTANNIYFNQFSPLINNNECFICHNYGQFATNCRSRLF